MLGITVGVATVLAMMAVGAGAQRSIEQQVRAAGLNQLTIKAGNWKPKTEDSGAAVAHQGDAERHAAAAGARADARAARRRRSVRWRATSSRPAIPKTTRWKSTTTRWPGSGSATSRPGSARRRRCRSPMPKRSASSTACSTSPAACTPTPACIVGDKRWFTRMHGTDLQLLDIKRTWTLSSGRFFTEREQERRRAGAWCSAQVVAEKLFGAGVDAGRQGRSRSGSSPSASWASSPAPAGSCGRRPETTSSTPSTCRTRRPTGCST